MKFEKNFEGIVLSKALDSYYKTSLIEVTQTIREITDEAWIDVKHAQLNYINKRFTSTVVFNSDILRKIVNFLLQKGRPFNQLSVKIIDVLLLTIQQISVDISKQKDS